MVAVLHYPEDTGGDDVPHTSLSPSWGSGSTAEFNAEPLIHAPLGDLFSTIARARITSHKARYTVEKKHSILSGNYIDVIDVRSWGEIEDLYDFNHEDSELPSHAAAHQIGYGNGDNGRSQGFIFRDQILIDHTYDYPFDQLYIPPPQTGERMP